MQIISLLLYNLIISLYGLGILITSLFNNKAKQWIAGRENQGPVKLPINAASQKKVWVHCASLGEFEQARPVIEKIKNNKPSTCIILTFFSPSGYEVRKNYKYADAVLYLPLDNAKNATDFIDAIQPDLVLFVKYEFWYHYLTTLKNRNIPAVLFSAIFRKEQVFFKWYGSFFRNLLTCFTKIFVQNKESQQLLSDIGMQSEISFDTRFDRVFEIAQTAKSFPLVEAFKGASKRTKLLIAGSTWKKDEALISKIILNYQKFSDFKFIIAPHNLSATEIKEFQRKLETDLEPGPPIEAIFLSELTVEYAESANVIIIDTMGDLSSLYRYADIVYVGGGFNASVHNVLEPAVYGVPIIFGPNYTKSAEAKELRQLSAAFPVSDAKQLATIITGLNSNNKLMKTASDNAKQYVQSHLGGVNDIYKYISRYL